MQIPKLHCQLPLLQQVQVLPLQPLPRPLSTTLPLLELGYDVLLAKPVCNNEKDLLALRDAAEKNGCHLFICHVLRYSPFYRKIKEVILSGEIGNIVHINTYEHVGVFLTSVSFVRGKWSKQSECGSSLLLAKCCHDIDLICWLNNDTTPDTVYSDGGDGPFVQTFKSLIFPSFSLFILLLCSFFVGDQSIKQMPV